MAYIPPVFIDDYSLCYWLRKSGVEEVLGGCTADLWFLSAFLCGSSAFPDVAEEEVGVIFHRATQTEWAEVNCEPREHSHKYRSVLLRS